jgi:hypothetical protein
VLLGQCRLHSLDVSRPRSSGKDQTWKLTWIDTSGGCCSTTNNNRFTRYFHRYVLVYKSTFEFS